MAAVVAFVDDLMFLSRIREAARGSGLDVQTARKVPDLVEAVRAGARLVLLDLDSPRLPSGDAVLALRGEAAFSVGFFSHVETERARQAREAGCGLVLPRSAFVARLPEILREAAQAPASPSPDTSRNTSS
jgi:DNA-binding NarL/FixJ family response regulator